MTIIKNRRIKKKCRNSFIVITIIFTLLFTGFIPLIDLPEGNISEEPKVWYDPQLSDFLFEGTVTTNNTFNAYNESYIISKIQNTDYTKFWFNGSQYDVSYGMNMIPVDFGTVNQSYSIDVSESDVNNEFFDWISVQPLYIESDVIDVNLDNTTDITFDAGGSISILVQPNFSYNWLYLEVDGTIVNNIYDTSSYPELDPVVAISTLSQGAYLQFDLEMNAQQHQLKIKGNGSVDYKIITNYDWDLDSVSDGEEIQKIGFDYRFDPIEPFVFGYFDQGDYFVYGSSSDFLSGLFTFYIPETYKGSGFTSMTIHSGEVKNIVIDENDLLYEGQTFETEILNSPITKWLGDLSSGYHMFSYDFAGNKSLLVSFSIDGHLIKILDRMNSLDSDGDGMKNIAEKDLGTDTLNPDSDFDGLYDGYDSSPLSSLVLDNESIAQIVFPHDSTKNTNIEISIERPENDYYTQDTMIWTDGDQDGGGLEVIIMPMLRLFGNSTINSTELENTWDKELVSYFITDTTSTYGDGVPDEENNNAEVCFIQPTVSNNSFYYTFTYKIGNSAKSDNKIDMRFDVVWTVFWIKQNSSEVIHYYDFDEDIVVQSILKNEFANASYYLASPDCNIENEILWNLVQNSELGTVSEFGVNDDIIGSGSVDYFGLEDQINEDRDANPISTDINGLFNETETLYVSLNFKSFDLLYKADVLDEWIIIPDEVKYHGDYEAYYSFYSCSDVLEEQVGMLIPEENIGNFHISYTKAWDNYSTGELGGFEQRYSINQHPIYMNRITTFQNAEILEVSSVFGETIPLNKLPNSLDEIAYDKLNLINTTIIEKNDDTSELANIGFDYDNDERKSILDSRLWEVPLSNLIFNRYSFSIAEKIIDALVYWAIYRNDQFIPLFPYVIPQLDFLQGGIEPSMYEMYFISEKSLDIAMGLKQGIYRGTNDYWNAFFRGTISGNIQTQGGWSSSFAIAMNDHFDTPIPERIIHCDYVLNWIESDQSTSYLRGERELRMEDIYAMEGLSPVERQHYLYDMQMLADEKVGISHTMRDELGNQMQRQKEILQAKIRPDMYRKGFVATFQGVSCLITGIMVLTQGIFELSNIDYTTIDLLETQLRIVSGVAKLLMAGTLLYMSALYFYKAFWSFKLIEKSIENSMGISGKICLIIGIVIALIDWVLEIQELGLGVDWYLNVKFWLHTVFFLLDIGLLFLATKNPVLGFGLMILVEIIRSIIFYEPPEVPYFPSMAFNTEKTSLTLPTANIKRNGGLEVGDVVNLTLSVYNDGNTMSYLQSNFSAGGDFSEYQGNWTDGYGYTVDEEQDINFTRTLSSTSNCLNLKVGVDIDSEVDETRTPIYEGTSEIISGFIVLDSTIGDFYDDLTEWDKPSIYDSLIEKYELLLDSYKHNETSEILNQLKQRIDYDFLDDSVGTMPSGWSATESDDGVFSTILRPNGDDLDVHKIEYSTGGAVYYTEIDEDIVDPSLEPDDPSTIIQWVPADYYVDESGYHGNYVAFDFPDFNSFSSCLGVKLHIFGGGNTDDATKFDISFDDGSSWEGEKSVLLDGGYEWYTLYWSGLDESDLDDFQARIQAPAFPFSGYSDLDVLYAEIFYNVSSIANTSLGSDYLNHNNIVNVSLYGENASRSLIRDFGSSKTSGTIEFWMCKDNYTRIDVDSFFRINKLGDIVKYNNDTSIRSVQLEINLWNNFKIDYTSTSFDLYLNGIKIGDDISYSDSDNTEFNFTISHDFQIDDVGKFNVSSTYFDAIDFSWSEGYYDGRSFYWDYSLQNITKYENLYDNLIVNASISTDLSENVVEMDTSTNIAEFVFDLDLDGTEDPNINITLFNIPTGFTANTTEIYQSLQDTINFKITDTGTLDYSGVYYFEMNITLNDNDTIIYYEKIPFRIPLVKDLDFDQSNIIYEETDIGNSTLIENITPTQISKGDVVNIEFKTNTYSEVLLNFINNDAITGTYSIMPRGSNYTNYQISTIIVDKTLTFDEISIDVIRSNYFNISKISIINANSVVGQNFNPITITNDGNAPEFISFDFSGIPFDNIDQTGYEEEFYLESQIVTVLPDETRQMNFNITLPTESISNLIWRGIEYSESGSGNWYNSYIDNLDFDGIYLASPMNMTYNIYGNNSLCGKYELNLDIIPEETLVWSAYSLNGEGNITFTGTANITLPETDGMYSIQVFGNNSIGTMFQSIVRNFTVSYPIKILSPEELDSKTVALFKELYNFENDTVGNNPTNFTVVEPSAEYGYVEVDNRMNDQHKPVELRNKGYNYAVSIQKTFDGEYTEGSINFKILKDSNDYKDALILTLLGTGGTASFIIEYANLYHGVYASKSIIELDVIKNSTWHNFVIEFDVSEGVQITVDDITYGAIYSIPFTTGEPSYITGLKVETKYDSSNPRDYRAWIDNIYVYEIEEGILLDVVATKFSDLEHSIDGESKDSFENPEVLPYSPINIPPSASSVSMINGSFDDSDNMRSNDGSYSEFTSTECVSIPDEFIDSITYSKGSSGAGTLANTQTDDSNYKQINCKSTYYGKPIYNWYREIDIYFNIDPVYAGRDFYFSCDIVSGQSMSLRVNGVQKASGTTIDFDDMAIEGVNNIRLVGNRMGTTFNSKVYYFKLVETGTPTPAVINFTIDVDFSKVNTSELTNLNVASYHYTNVSTDIIGNIYDYNAGTYIEMFSSSNTVETKNSFVNSNNIERFLDSNGNLRLYFTGSNTDNDFELSVDYIRIKFYYKILSLYGEHSIVVYGKDFYGDIYRSENRSFSVPALILTSPENRTYKGGMNGINNGTYPASYGFEDDTNGELPDGWTNHTILGSPDSEYIQSLTYSFGSYGSGTISNTQTDDSNYIRANSEYFSQESMHHLYITFNFKTALSGRNFNISAHIETSGDSTGSLWINSEVWKSGSTIDFDDHYHGEITHIGYSSESETASFSSNVYFFEIFEIEPTINNQFEVVSEYEGHAKVLQGYDYGTGYLDLRHTLTTTQSYGTVEFWFAIDSISDNAGSQIHLRDSSNDIIGGIKTNETTFCYYGSDDAWHSIDGISVLVDRWYHIRIDLEQTSGSYMGLQQNNYRILIDGVDYGDFTCNSTNNLYDIHLTGSDDNIYEDDFHMYFDAFGFSWDTNYSIGDNKYEGFLIEFTALLEFQSLSYSLDDGDAIAISGNTIISVPSVGSHSIQIFGTSDGEEYESKKQYFSIA